MSGGIFHLRNFGCFCLWLNNRQPDGKTNGIGGFGASNWSKTNPPRISGDALQGGEESSGGILTSGICDVFPSSSIIQGQMDKWMQRLDSTCHKGTDIT